MDSAHKIGFALLTHTNPGQVKRLINKLNRMFNNPPIACHHDFSQSDLDESKLPQNVMFVRPYLKTEWGCFSVVEATIKMLKLLYNLPSSPEWYILISGTDYPIKLPHYIMQDLLNSPYDAHIHYEEIKYKCFQFPWQKIYFDRYCRVTIPLIFVNKNLGLVKREIFLTHPFITRFFLPFSKNFHCFGGSQWFSANHRAVEYILQYYDQNKKLSRYYCKRNFPEESYFQTVLANAPHLQISKDAFRYIDWSLGGAHPKILVMDDLENILSSNAHFARKFDPDIDKNILDELDLLIQ